jgi:alkylation response protein AidB-like acyl-CoA dehydrogenase
MDALFDEDETLLHETAKHVVGRLAPTSVRDLESYDGDGAWKALQEIGLPALRIPEECGGGGGTTVDASIVVTAVAEGMVPVPYLGSILACELLMVAGAPTSTLQRVADGRLRLSVGLSGDLLALAGTVGPGATAEVIGFDAAGVDAMLVFDPLSSQLRAVTVKEWGQGLDITRVTARSDASAPVDVGDLGGALDKAGLARFLARAHSYVSADLVGVMSAALDAAVDHAASRQQFGAAIGSRQALQHLAADQLVALEGARSLAEYAAWSADQDDLAGAVEAAREAKAYCSRAGQALCEAVVQIHGGMGFTWECMAHLYLKRALVDGCVFGDQDHHINQLARTRRSPAG